MTTNWIYVETERHLWTVGFYDPRGTWHTDSDHTDREKAARRVHYLNGERQESDDIDEGGSLSEYKNRYPNRWLTEALNEGNGVYKP